MSRFAKRGHTLQLRLFRGLRMGEVLMMAFRNSNRNLGISRAPLKNQAHQGTMQLIHERCDESKGLPKGSSMVSSGPISKGSEETARVAVAIKVCVV